MDSRLRFSGVIPANLLPFDRDYSDMHNRMKEALAILGRISGATVRPPLQPVSAAERERIRAALASAALL
jgi:4-hydroxy-tetrahydrodipicolinate synthase